MLLTQLFPNHSSIWWSIQLLSLAEGHTIHMPYLPGGEGSSFPCCVAPDDKVYSRSVVGATPGDSGVVIEFQVDEFTGTLLAECFIAQSHIYPGFTGKVSPLPHFPLEPGWEDYSILGRYALQ